MGTPLYKITGHKNPDDEFAFDLTIETDSVKLIKDSIKKYKRSMDNIDLFETKYFVDDRSYPKTFIIINIDPIIFNENTDVYSYKMHCYGNDVIESKLKILELLFDKHYIGGKR